MVGPTLRGWPSKGRGRDWSLADFPLADQFASPETVRAEEVVLSVPDGRSVRTLLNATPIPEAGGTARTVVVTLQDLAPLDEIERLRIEFLGLVSRELRTPLAAAPPAMASASRSAGGWSRRTAAGEPSRILVVDDDPRTLRFVRDALSKAGYAPLVTGSAEELSAIMRAERPRLVLLELLLPGRDGIELLEEVPELANIPVIFISAYGRDETVARVRGGRRRLRRQAVLADRAGGARARGAAPPRGAGANQARRARHPLRHPRGDGGRPRRGPHRHRVRIAARAVDERRARGAVRHPDRQPLVRRQKKPGAPDSTTSPRSDALQMPAKRPILGLPIKPDPNPLIASSSSNLPLPRSIAICAFLAPCGLRVRFLEPPHPRPL